MNNHLYNFQIPEEKQIRVIVDTDAKNEADDPFAIVHALLSPGFDYVGLIAAHYGVDRDIDSMERSYAEIKKILNIMDIPADGILFHGADAPMTKQDKYIMSEGAELIVREAMKEDSRRLFVIFLGPLTDLASAILLEPRIVRRMTAIWIGGGAYPNGGQEFNLKNDIIAANAVFSSQVELWQVPKNVYEKMAVSLSELQVRVQPYGELGNYLFDQLIRHTWDEIPRKSSFRTGESWVLGDNPAVGLILYEHRFEFEWKEAPFITGEQAYVHTKTNRPIRVYQTIDSRLILEDFYAKLKIFARNEEEAHE